ncbi:T9SS type A sorting domain-containing protein [candidate division KSB1 bacterium]|nr:T9SS type A sorting domain-containing protein [candidate division KSB1 bacterium]NIU23951.1 T9SS type A sorting domain-containing protein [candidate division KSB1 bacterium]NIU92551.1 T9SS type A sorting domain-containing protein [candidate division KSB1 bacterium]NIV95105.1 T9SS type A sorting domain-containing protein [candidate division KSB1 bacterium]NIW17800.1 T9SS type A sorting domain-containing protein [candidate division KSB1 bacterium]
MKRVILFVCMTIIPQQSVFAQQQIAQSVFANGGKPTSNESLRISGTLGQPLVGQSENASTTSSSGFWYQTVDIVTSVEQIPDETLPKEFRLEQNYPNPFNPTTTIAFQIPKRSDVTLKLYDIRGRKITTILDEQLDPGKYEVKFNASALSSGVYFYQIQADEFVKSRKLTLLK